MEKGAKPTLYLYRSPFGMLTIRKDLDREASWLFVFETQDLASNGEVVVQVMTVPHRWTSAEAVAEAVHAQLTGWDLWDTLPPVVFPATLEDWMPMDPSGVTVLR